MTAHILAEAELDLETAFQYYESARLGLGVEMLNEFRRGVGQILLNPGAWQALDAEYRRYRLHRFPYGIIYRTAKKETEILIVAIIHLSRKPDVWHGRQE